MSKDKPVMLDLPELDGLVRAEHSKHRASMFEAGQDAAKKFGKQIDEAIIAAYKARTGLVVQQEQIAARKSAWSEITDTAVLQWRFILTNKCYNGPNSMTYSAYDIREGVQRAIIAGLIKPEDVQ